MPDLHRLRPDRPRGPRAKGISAFIVDMSQAGVSVGREEEKLGLNSASTCEVVLQDVRVQRSELLGEEGKGFAIALHTLDGGRIGIAAQAIGITQAALDVALATPASGSSSVACCRTSRRPSGSWPIWTRIWTRRGCSPTGPPG